MSTRTLFQSALSVAALLTAVGVAAQSAPSAPSPSGARKGYPTAQAQERAAAQANTRQLTNASNATLEANAVARCAPLPEGYKEACLDRMRGGGQETGSVAGGGILRSSETTVELAPMPAAPQLAPAERVEDRAMERAERKHKRHHPKAVKPVQ